MPKEMYLRNQFKPLKLVDTQNSLKKDFQIHTFTTSVLF
jgi:hypothetical protein